MSKLQAISTGEVCNWPSESVRFLKVGKMYSPTFVALHFQVQGAISSLSITKTFKVGDTFTETITFVSCKGRREGLASHTVYTPATKGNSFSFFPIG